MLSKKLQKYGQKFKVVFIESNEIRLSMAIGKKLLEGANLVEKEPHFSQEALESSLVDLDD